MMNFQLTAHNHRARRRRRRRQAHRSCDQNNRHIKPCYSYCKGKASTQFALLRNRRHLQSPLSMNLCILLTLQTTLSLLCAASFFGPNIFYTTTSFIAPSTIINQRRRNRNELLPTINNRASLFVTLQLQSALGKNIEESHSNIDDDKSRKEGAQPGPHPLTVHPDKLIQKLESFIPNISRNRMAKKKRTKRTLDSKPPARRESMSYNVNDALINACTSLVYFLNNEADSLNTLDDHQLQLLTQTVESIREVLEMVLVQAVRAASEVGDFVLINKLIHAAVGYATAVALKTNTTSPLLTPRIFGEAITSMSKTKASHSKVKSLWNLFLNDVASNSSQRRILSSPPSSYELNAMLSSLSERNKVSAALTLYRHMIEDENVVKIEGDAYTASILFGMLADSIGNGGVVRNTNGRVVDNLVADDVIDGDVSPCWQWNEAIRLLDTFSTVQLNNFAYAALLKVNEQATEVYCEAGMMRHNGVQCAMSVLERMKVSQCVCLFSVRLTCICVRFSGSHICICPIDRPITFLPMSSRVLHS